MKKGQAENYTTYMYHTLLNTLKCHTITKLFCIAILVKQDYIVVGKIYKPILSQQNLLESTYRLNVWRVVPEQVLAGEPEWMSMCAPVLIRQIHQNADKYEIDNNLL